MDIVQALCQEFHLKTQQCENVLRLIDDGNTIPFIARYRKEQTGSLDDQLLREIYERLQYLRGLDKRRGEIAAALEKARDDLEKLEVLNARIPAAALSAQISRMEKAGAAILQQVREHPEKGRDIRKFVTYYLPTAVKILTTYADLSASGAGGENAKSLMSDVEKNAGTIASAFEAQLDALFAGEVLDVSSDIAVLDGMLSGDGLSGKNNLKLS